MKLFSIPNIITLGNLLCGCVAVVFAFNGNPVYSAYLVGIAAVLDFADGFAARALKQHSPIGKELDSLADMVTFGLVPGVTMFMLLQQSFLFYGRFYAFTDHPVRWASFAFLIVLFSALRLAKFNVDTRQSDSFIGVPTPANSILICSLPLILHFQGSDFNGLQALILNPFFLFGVTLVMSILLVAELPLFALKFKSFGWKGNEVRYIFLGLSVALLALLKFIALPLVIVFYVVLSVITRFASAEGRKSEGN